MNLLISRVGILIVLFILFFTSCKDNSEIKLDPSAEQDKIGTYLIDTVSITTSTVQLEDVFTKSTGSAGRNNNLLVGRHTDPYLGTIEASGFTDVNFFDTKKSIKGDNPELVSFQLTLDFDYLYGDSTGTQTVNVYEIDTLDFRSAEYKSSDQQTLKRLLNPSDKAVNLSASNKGKVVIQLDKERGQELLTSLKQDPLKSEYYIKGLALIPGIDNTSVLGADPDSSFISLFYKANRTDTAIIKENFAFLNVSGTSVQYNNIRRVSGSPFLPILTPATPLPSENVQGNLSFVQSGTGLVTKVSFPYLDKLRELGTKVAINKAELVVEPIQVNQSYSTPPSVYLLRVTNDNRIAKRGDIYDVFPIAEQKFFDGRLIAGNTSTYDPSNNRYIIPLTIYLENLLRAQSDTTESFFIYPSVPGGYVQFDYSVTRSNTQTTIDKLMSLDRLVIPKDKLKLKIYYTLVP